MANELKIDDAEPWYLRQPEGEPSRHLQVWCGNAYLLVRKEDGLTEIGYTDEGGESVPLATDGEIGDWLAVLQWRAAQTFPRVEQRSPGV